jgi:hypothetical protein
MIKAKNDDGATLGKIGEHYFNKKNTTPKQ